MSKTILFAVDGSAVSQVALQWVQEWASAWQARVVVFHAYLLPFAASQFHNMEAEYTAEISRQVLAERQKLVEHYTQTLCTAGIQAEGKVMHGEPRELILAVAHEEKVDLIIMGRRGLGTWQGLLLGSVSQYIVHHAQVPVLLIPAQIASSTEARNS